MDAEMSQGALVQTPYHLLQAMADRLRNEAASYAVFVVKARNADGALAGRLAAAARSCGLFDRVEVVGPFRTDAPADLFAAATGRLRARARARLRAAIPDISSFERFAVFQALGGLPNLLMLARLPGCRVALLEDGVLNYTRLRRHPRLDLKDVLRYLRSRTGLTNDHTGPFLLPLPPFDEIRVSEPARFDAVHAGEGQPPALPVWLPEGASLDRFRTAVARTWPFDARSIARSLLVLGSVFPDLGLSPDALRAAATAAVRDFRDSLRRSRGPISISYKPHPREKEPMVDGCDTVVDGAIPLEALWMACRPEDAPSGILALFPSSGLATIRAAFPLVPLVVVYFEGSGSALYERAFETSRWILQGDPPIAVRRAQVPHD